jgi:hypothetical protein
LREGDFDAGNGGTGGKESGDLVHWALLGLEKR